MAANEIVFSVKVQKDGNLKVIAKDAEAAAGGTEKLGKETDNLSKKRRSYQKVEKGVGQAGLSTAKGFSKQAGAISGGLVPAYAILAANIFAITAAFNALKEAAQVEALKEGFATLGNVVGRTSSLMAEELIRITDGAISMDSALRSAAAGFSAGFSLDEMSKLADIAKGASIALGRDLSDALDRLIRGTAKLEPEILDELGLFIRLDDAAAKYAQTLNKSVGSLTQAERRQAFLNEALEQGERKFSAVSNVKTNPFDKLAAAASNLAKGLLSIINVAIVPFINLLSNNMVILVGVFVLFANSVASTMLPALYGLGAAQRERGDDALETAGKISKAQNKEVKAIEKLARVQQTAMSKKSKFANLQGNLGTKNEKEGDLAEMIKSLDKSSKARETFMNKNKNKITAVREQEKAEIDALIAKLRELENARAGKGQGAAELKLQQGFAGVQDKLADNMEGINKAGALGGFGLAFQGTKEYSKDMKELNKGVSKAKGIFSFLPNILGGVGKALGTAGVAARLFGVALINAIPVIGQLLFVGGLLIQLLVKWLGKTTEISAAQDRLNKVTEGMAEKFEQLNKSQKKSIARAELMTSAFDKNVEAGFRLMSEMKVLEGVVAEVQESFMGLTQELGKGGITAADKLKRRWDQFFTFWKNGWKKAGSMAMRAVDFIGEITPDLGFMDWLLGSDADVASDMLTSGFVDPLKEMIEQGKNQDQIEKLFASMGIDSKEAGAVEAVAASLKKQAQEMVANGKATNVNTAYAGLLNAKLKTLKTSTDELVTATTGAATAFDESSQSIRAFFSKAIGKDTFMTMAKDAQTLSKALASVATTGDDAQILLDNIKKTEGGWLRQFFGTKEEFEAAGIDEIAPLLKEIEERSMKISEQQKNAALHTKNFAAQIKFATAEVANLKQAYKFNDLIKAQNVFGRSLDGVAVTTKRINAMKDRELELQNKIFKSKQRQITMEMDFKINETEFLQMALDSDSERYKLLDDQLELLRLIKGERLDTLDVENDISEQVIKQNSVASLLKNATIGKMSGTMGEKLGGMRRLGSAKDAIRGSKDQIIASGRDEFLAANTLPSTPAAGSGQKLNGQHNVENGGGSQVNVTALNAAGEAAFDSAMYQAGLVDLQNQVMLTDGMLKTMQESLANFGPDGELIIAFSTGINTATTGFIQMASSIDANSSAMESGAAMAAGVASAISATASIMTAASNARIAGIENEIKAEQKRDGKSKQSLAKIKALEAKKDAMARKAFETNKKLMMAQTIANTAAAVMGILAMEGSRVGALAIPMAIAVGAMGAAQLAIIAGTSYQGGGSGGGAVTGPSQISIGKRKEGTDISKSKSAGGELSYFRGESGTGGPENFQRAFYGKKNRAAGGNTGYVVGEQGPELFMPDRPGTIVPSDDVAQMGGGSNVTFNISTVDATGVEDLLVEQQGNIIGMLRQAANSYGQGFLEDIDETTYTSPQARRA